MHWQAAKTIRTKNKVKIAEYQKEYAKKNQQALRENKKRHYLKNKDKIIKRVNSWHKQNYKSNHLYKLNASLEDIP